MSAGKARICLLTPGHLSTNPRIVKEADALAEAGYDVTVVAADYLEWARAADQEYSSRAWRRARPVSFGPDAPRRARATQVLRQRGARLLTRCGFSGPRLDAAAWHPAGPDLIRAALATTADLYIAHYPAALPAAALAARRHCALYAFDAEDFHPGDLPADPKYVSTRRLLARIEGRYLRGCAYITAASPGIAEAYSQAHGVRPVTLLNVFPAVQAPPAATERGCVDPGPSLYWFSQTIGPNRGLELALRAIAHSSSRPHLYLRGAIAPGFGNKLTGLAEELGIGDRLHFLDVSPPEGLAALAARYDIGLASEIADTENRAIALTNKLFTYLLAGVPVAASDIPAHRAIAPQLGPAIHLFAKNDPSSLAGILDRWLATPAALAAARAHAFALGQNRFNWEHESPLLVTRIEAALTGRDRLCGRAATD